MNEFLSSYIETALWSSMDNTNDQGGEPLDKNYSASDLAPETLTRMTTDCEQFQAKYTIAVNALDYVSGDFEESRVAHDFWRWLLGWRLPGSNRQGAHGTITLVRGM
jgi:hypothetical protein